MSYTPAPGPALYQATRARINMSESWDQYVFDSALSLDGFLPMTTPGVSAVGEKARFWGAIFIISLNIEIL
jgi:hypothetical protein